MINQRLINHCTLRGFYALREHAEASSIVCGGITQPKSDGFECPRLVLPAQPWLARPPERPRSAAVVLRLLPFGMEPNSGGYWSVGPEWVRGLAGSGRSV